MDKNQIGTNAGIVWNILKDNAHWEYEDLKAATGLSDRELNAAIGWLAREDKIDFDMDQNHDRLFLHVNGYIGLLFSGNVTLLPHTDADPYLPRGDQPACICFVSREKPPGFFKNVSAFQPKRFDVLDKTPRAFWKCLSSSPKGCETVLR